MATYNANQNGVRFGVTENLAAKLASLTNDGPLIWSIKKETSSNVGLDEN